MTATKGKSKGGEAATGCLVLPQWRRLSDMISDDKKRCGGGGGVDGNDDEKLPTRRELVSCLG